MAQVISRRIWAVNIILPKKTKKEKKKRNAEEAAWVHRHTPMCLGTQTPFIQRISKFTRRHLSPKHWHKTMSEGGSLSIDQT